MVFSYCKKGKKSSVPEYIWAISLIVIAITLIISIRVMTNKTVKLTKSISITDVQAEIKFKIDDLGGFWLEKLRFKIPKDVDEKMFIDNLYLVCYDDQFGTLELPVKEMAGNFLAKDKLNFYVLTKPIHLAGPDETTVLYYTFDDCEYNKNLTKDYSGNRNHGIIYGNPKCVDGIKGKALEFNRSQIIKPVYPNLLYLENKSFTFLAFLKNANGSKTFSHYQRVSDPHKYLGWWIDPNYAGDFRFCAGQKEDGNTPCIFGTSLDKITKNSWLMLTCILSLEKKEIYCYYNTTKKSSTIIFSFRDTTENFVLGGWMSGSRTFKGVIDETFIFSRVLKPYEIQTMYHLNCWKKGARWYLFVGKPEEDGILIKNVVVE